ncbi:hypothetical protein BDW62DRAFT_214983 [Aspergillus aurantiobrunneus]
MPFPCPFPGCDSSYLRKEHLQRHLVQHTADTPKAPCPFCDRGFARHSDTMRRHARKAHLAETKRLCDMRSERTCRACRVARSSCEGRDPCRRCLREKLRCSLSNDRDSRTIDNTSSTIQYTQRYFQNFHPRWPLLHPATFTVRDEPSLLVYSVVAIGLWTDETPSSRASALALHDLIGNSICQQKSQWDGTFIHSDQKNHTASAWPIATYQGILLHLVLSLLMSRRTRQSRQCSLSQSDYDVLVALVRTCRRHNLFFYPRMLGRYQGINSMACIWVGVEEIKRLGIALYRVCELCSSSGGGRPNPEFLTLSDLQFPMLDSNDLWNAESNVALSRRLAEVEPSAVLDGRREENRISNLGEDVLLGCFTI